MREYKQIDEKQRISDFQITNINHLLLRVPFLKNNSCLVKTLNSKQVTFTYDNPLIGIKNIQNKITFDIIFLINIIFY